MSLSVWIKKQLANLDPQLDDVATVENAAIVTELKHRTFAAGLFELSLSLPIEPRKYPISVAAQLRRVLGALDSCVPSPGEGGDTLSPPEVGRILGVSPDTVLEWIRNNELKASNLNKPGKRPRYAIVKDDLNEFMKRRQPSPKPVKIRKRRETGDVMEIFK